MAQPDTPVLAPHEGIADRVRRNARGKQSTLAKFDGHRASDH
jgi:hypothetical protein